MELITYKCNGYQLEFVKENGMLKVITFKNHVLKMDSLIWRLEVKNNNGDINEVTIHNNMAFLHNPSCNGVNLCWQNNDYRIMVTLDEEDSKLKWTISVDSLVKENGIYKVIFPILGEIKAISEGGTNDFLILPWQSGWLLRNPINTFFNNNDNLPFWAGRGGHKYENEYPAAYSYQFTAYYSPDRYGLYFCTEDGEAYIKTMGYYSRPGGGFDFAVTNCPENMGSTCEYRMPYKFAFQIFEGDWQNAAALYRKWAIQQKWCMERLADTKLPENLLRTDLWRINHTNYKLGTRT